MKVGGRQMGTDNDCRDSTSVMTIRGVDPMLEEGALLKGLDAVAAAGRCRARKVY